MASTSGISARALNGIQLATTYLSLLGSAVNQPQIMAGNLDSWMLLDSVSNAATSQEFYKMLQSSIASTPFDTVMNVNSKMGSDGVRAAVADYTNRFLLRANATNASKWAIAAAVEPENIAIVPGVTGAMDWATYALTNQGDSVLVPTPFFASLIELVGARNNVTIEPVPMLNNTKLTVDALIKANDAAKKAGRPAKMLILTNPNNPTGVLMTRQELADAIKWAVQNKVHVLSDEVYARSLWDDKVQYVSALEVAAQLAEQHPELADDLQKYVHVAWSLSKDLGAEALRFGWLATHNEAVLNAMLAANAGQSMVPSVVQAAVADVLRNTSALEGLFNRSVSRMRNTYNMVAGNLTNLDIPFTIGQTGLFIWIDLRDHLPAPGWDGEKMLEQMLAKHQIALAPGAGFGASEPGFFRVGLGSASTQKLSQAVDRMQQALEAN